jgi:hypothetical protein
MPVQWILWAAGTGVSFAVLEFLAIRSKRSGDTLSERTRARFHAKTRQGAAVFGAVLFGFAVWFFGHIVWGWA